MKNLALTPFIKFFSITTIAMFISSLMNKQFAQEFLVLDIPFGIENSWKLLTYQFILNDFIDLLFTLIVFYILILPLEKYYGTIKIFIFFFMFGILNGLFSNFIGINYTISGSNTSFVGFGIIFLLQTWNDKQNFILFTIKSKYIFYTSIVFSILTLSISIYLNKYIDGPCNIISIILGCLIFKYCKIAKTK